MGLARVSVFVGTETELRAHPFVKRSGERVAWLEVGDGSEVGLWGSPAAMRRLAAALVVTAVQAEELPARAPAQQATLRAVQGL